MLKPIGKHIYYLDHQPETDRPLLAAVVGENHCLMIDSGNSSAHAELFQAELQKVTKKKVNIVALTHWHWDHTFGLQAIDGVSVAHKLTKVKLKEYQSFAWDDAALDQRVRDGIEIEFCQEMIKKELPDRSNLHIQTPVITFDKSLKIDLGDISCRIDHIGGDHAEDSSVIYIPEEKMVFLGDCLSPDFYSGSWSYDSSKLEKVIEQVRSYNANWYATSHDYVETKAELFKYLDQLQQLSKIVGDYLFEKEMLTKFKEELHRSPAEDEQELLNYFLQGNRKKEKQ
ncbi:MBL fold metallo-hydrolase [Priestia flexa]|uniref:MBL fold metallo-hydrolase n=1 Tax=Priestia flexa TaxID=86664 RepID=UPI00203DDC43|nr:MBL fold metallo-hydrolase [Priestia flexa]MCM3065794.1 MBL fold metallo-hydrolase [Priestia flexa]